MITIYVAESRDRVKMSDDRDCLPADAIRVETRIFPTNADVFRAAIAYQKRGFSVCVDTETIDCFEFEPEQSSVSRLHLSASLDEFDPFQAETPCWDRPVWLSKLRQIALIEAAEELNERFHDVTNDRFNPQYESYVLPKGKVG